MALAGPTLILGVLAVIVAAILAIFIVIYVLVPLLKGIGWIIGKFFWLIGATIAHIFRFIIGMFRDTLRAIGAIPSGALFALLSVGSVVIGRWSSATHFARNMQHEFKTFMVCIYRVAIGHPLRLIGLASMLEGIEQRVPAALAEAPGSDKPNRRTGTFDGYTIVGSLPGGGSGGRLYIAEPKLETQGRIEKEMGHCPERVVIKSFAVADGSSLPQIVRESRALECAKQLGLILEHDLAPERFFYVMEYVPGENLAAVTRQLHSDTNDAGLDERRIHRVLSILSDVLSTLTVYHSGGLWHKDIKPENIIIHDGRAHIVDLGLVTPLRSAMTLTTHGTEYFRDPEMVRMALKGVKVHEVDGAKFDIYAAGAVLFFVLENTFPSHGGLSTVSNPCPDAIKWVVRRAMTDYSQRYASADMMLSDVKAVMQSQDIYGMKPVDLPSMGSAGAGIAADAAAFDNSEADAPSIGVGGFGAGVAANARHTPQPDYTPHAQPQPQKQRDKVRLRVTNWWTGGYKEVGDKASGARPIPPISDLREQVPAAREQVKEQVKDMGVHIRSEFQRVKDQWGDRKSGPAQPHAAGVAHAPVPADHRRSAAEQRNRAQQRARNLRGRARNRSARHAHAPGERLTVGIVIASAVVFAFILAAGSLVFLFADSNRSQGTRLRPAAYSVTQSSAANSTAITPATPNEGSIIVETWSRESEKLQEKLRQATGGLNERIENAKAQLQQQANGTTALRTAVKGIPQGFIIINDHPKAMTDSIDAKERALFSATETLGFEFVDDQDSEALVRARVNQWITGPYIDANAPDFATAEAAVGALLGDDLEDIGCVVWIYPVVDDADRLALWVITPNPRESTLDDRILAYLLPTLDN